MESIIYLETAKILTYTALSFFIGLWWAPFLISVLNWLKFWKKKARSSATTGEELTVTKQFYEENEKNRLVPRAGGILIWVTTLGFAFIFWLFLKIEPTNQFAQFLNFVSRRETFIPIGTLFLGSALGFIDDTLAILEDGGNYFAGGLRLSHRVFFVVFISLLIGLWFYFKIDLTTFSIFGWQLSLENLTLPFGLNGAILIIPLTFIILLACWGTGIIDGLDGLAAGVFIPVYLCFAGLAFARGFYDISTFLMVMAGATMAYLWFNIPPAKFIMGDTGSTGILLTLGVISMLINYIYILPIAGFILFVTEFSAIVQVFSKKFLGKKVFRAAPLHHHLEAIGWKREQITMRFWLISIMTSALGLAVGLIFL